MNRLWFRLALAFSGVVFVVIVLMIILDTIVFPVQEFRAIVESLDSFQELEETMVQREPYVFVARISIVLAVGAIAAMFVSRSLLRPLDRLITAAQAIGRQDLTQRVEIPRGSTELAELTHAFNTMAADLEQAESLRRNLMADIAHELRTPLTVIQGNLQALIDDVYELNKEEVVGLYEQTRHLKHLVDDLHLLAQAEAHRLPLNEVDVPIVSLIKEVVEPFRPLVEGADVELRQELLGKLGSINGDPARLRQALSNLLSNALRHTPAGGTITVTAERNSNHLQIHVRDTGSGIDADHLPHIFDRFYRTDWTRSRDTGGAGLGLAIARAIVTAHGGQLTVTSPGVGLGARFTLELPLLTGMTIQSP